LPDTDSVVELVDLHCFVEVAGPDDSQRFVEEAGSVGFAVVVELLYLEVVEQNWSLQPLQKMYKEILDQAFSPCLGQIRRSSSV
jgi:hypothetical protein